MHQIEKLSEIRSLCPSLVEEIKKLHRSSKFLEHLRKVRTFIVQKLMEPVFDLLFSTSFLVKFACFFKVDTVVFDKTGTITHGKPHVFTTKLLADRNFIPWRKFLAIIGSAEANSEHPLGTALKNYAIDVSDTESLTLVFVPGVDLRRIFR